MAKFSPLTEETKGAIIKAKEALKGAFFIVDFDQSGPGFIFVAMSLLDFFIEGIEHITDFGGFDHMLFLLALTTGFLWKDRLHVLLLATAFTIGHAITLYLAAAEIVSLPSAWIELLIAVTILVTAIIRIFRLPGEKADQGIIYLITLAIGLIHGMGFSSFFRMISDHAPSPLAGLGMFTLGVEAGQVMVIAVILLVNTLAFRLPEPGFRVWCRLTAGLAAVVSVWLIADRLPGLFE